MNTRLPLFAVIMTLLITGCQSPESQATGPVAEPDQTLTSIPVEAAGQQAGPPTTPLLPPSWASILIQAPDDSLIAFDRSGEFTTFSTPGFRLLGGAFNEAVYTEPGLYAVGAGTLDQPPGLYLITTENTTRLSFVPQSADSVAVWPGDAPGTAPRLAWSELSSREDHTLESVIWMSVYDRDAIVELGRREGQDRILSVVGWSGDGETLYYTQEPLISGGYTLFGGFSTLYALDVESREVTEIIGANRFEGASACLDELSPDDTLLALHCEAPALLDLVSGELRIIQLPQAATALSEVGTLRFSPDGSRVALALAVGDFETEQGAVALADATSGQAGIIVESQPGAYYEVAGWLDADTLVLQEWDLTSGYGSVYQYSLSDGMLQLVAAGQFVTFLPELVPND